MAKKIIDGSGLLVSGFWKVLCLDLPSWDPTKTNVAAPHI